MAKAKPTNSSASARGAKVSPTPVASAPEGQVDPPPVESATNAPKADKSGPSAPTRRGSRKSVSFPPGTTPQKTASSPAVAKVPKGAHASANGTAATPSTDGRGRQLKPTKHTNDPQVLAWRNAQVEQKQRELQEIVDRHEEYVCELFHLQTYVSLIDYDPETAKHDKSVPFQAFQTEYDLYVNNTPATADGVGRRPGRRAVVMHKPEPPSPPPIHSRRQSGSHAPAAGSNVKGKTDVKGKGKALVDVKQEEPDALVGGKKKVAPSNRRKSQLEPTPEQSTPGSSPGPSRASGLTKTSAAAMARTSSGSSAPGKNGKRSLDPLSIDTAAASSSRAKMIDFDPDEDSPPGSPNAKRVRLSQAAPGPLTNPVGFWPVEHADRYTHPLQMPLEPKFNNSLQDLMRSYLSLDQYEGPPEGFDIDGQDAHDAAILNETAALEVNGFELPNPDKTASNEAKRSKAHWDHLVDQAVHFSKLVHDERKAHLSAARRTGRMIIAHFDKAKGRDLKLAKEEERRIKLLAKETAKEIRKKWKLAVNVVKAQRKERLREEQERIGKEQMNKMLDKSTTILHAQNVEMNREEEETSEEEEEESEEEDEEEEEEEEEEASEEELSEEDQSETASLIAPPTPDPLSPPRRHRRPPRARSRLSISATPDIKEEDLEEGDVAFDVDEDEARENEDQELFAAMEDEDEDEDDEDEDEDAGLSVEELRRKYGFEQAVAPETNADAMEVDPEPEAPSTNGRTSPPPVARTNGRSSRRQVNGNGVSSSAPADRSAEEAEAEALSEFGSEQGDDAREDEDAKLQAEMEAEDQEVDEDDDEDAELLADGKLTMEQLRAKYYGAVAEAEVEGTPEPEVAEEQDGEEEEEGDEEDEEEDGEEEEDEDEDEDEEMEVDDDDEGAVTKAPADKVSLRPPFLLRAKLRPYQQDGLEWLASLYTNGVNGILADEMGLGKTIQTISLLAHLACDRGQWGPHLVVVPTSVMLNWEMEFKKFLPGFKILTYYGNVKERRDKRKGWNTPNAFHVCVTSYQLILADQHVFRRKAWHYLILDEAHHIKNFRSQRWQTLLGFNARHRLLLTGTPLQNNLMELWSLLYFLMPHGLIQDGQSSFAGHADFQSWFSNPMEKAIENGEAMDEETKQTVAKLHTILRPYLLRRLKAEVETQMPGKTESIIYCRLSKRQRFLYDDFMSRAQTRETLGSGHFLSIINCLMQLRKVCNHPDLFEVRPIVTSFSMANSVANDFEPKELLVRRRLLAEEPIAQIDWSSLTLVKPDNEADNSSIAANSRLALDPKTKLRSLIGLDELYQLPAEPPKDTRSLAGWRRHREWSAQASALGRLDLMAQINSRRCQKAKPVFGSELFETINFAARENALLPVDVAQDPRGRLDRSEILPLLVKSAVQRAQETDELISKFAFVTPKAKAASMVRHALAGVSEQQVQQIEEAAPVELLQRASTRLSVAFPDASLLQYDCGKLQKLDELLRECKAGGHRVLIFTQMTKVLDILEMFLSFHGHRYLRLDGSTKIEQRQIITERFNSNDKILCFISSTRSGGLGINLQGADTVIFYDSDWNPALDRQCQDRAHRIGQTREVRIWRFVTEHSIEENMLKKANQKRKLDEMVISDGDFTTDYLQKLDWRDYLDDQQIKELGVDDDPSADPANLNGATSAGQSAQEIRLAMAAAEDEEDAAAARLAEGELQVDASDFAEGAPKDATHVNGSAGVNGAGGVEEVPVEEEDEDPLQGTIDGYMVKFVDDNFDIFA